MAPPSSTSRQENSFAIYNGEGECSPNGAAPAGITEDITKPANDNCQHHLCSDQRVLHGCPPFQALPCDAIILASTCKHHTKQFDHSALKDNVHLARIELATLSV